MPFDAANHLECIICGAVMIAGPGRAMCPNCGYQEDATDIFPASPPTRHPAPTFSMPIGYFEETLFPLFPLKPEAPKPPRRRLPRQRPPLPPTGWLFSDN